MLGILHLQKPPAISVSVLTVAKAILGTYSPFGEHGCACPSLTVHGWLPATAVRGSLRVFYFVQHNGMKTGGGCVCVCLYDFALCSFCFVFVIV